MREDCFFVVGLCTDCNIYYGVKGNDGKCSHCYSMDGPQQYRECAIKFRLLQQIEKELLSELQMSNGEYKFFEKTFIRSGTEQLKFNKVFKMLTGKKISVKQAISLKQILKPRISQHDVLNLDKFLINLVIDYWNLKNDDWITLCTYPEKMTIPKNIQEAKIVINCATVLKQEDIYRPPVIRNLENFFAHGFFLQQQQMNNKKVLVFFAAKFIP